MEPDTGAMAAAEAAFISSFDGPGGNQPAPAAPAPAPTPSSEPSTTQGEAPTTEERFSLADPATLPEEVRPYYKSLQADYTRKAQDLASVREQFKAFEAMGIDPQQALQAAQVMQRLDNDPNFAMQVAQHLQSELQQRGQWVAPTAPAPTVNPSFEGDEMADPHLTAIQSQMQAFEDRLASMQQQAQVAEYRAYIASQESAVREIHPEYTKDHMSDVYNLAHATNGNLVEASQMYERIRQGAVAEAFATKQALPTPTTPAQNLQIPPAEKTLPQGFTLNQGHEAALEAIRQIERASF